MNKRIVVLGAGISGTGAAVLAKKKGFDVFVSDNGKITNESKKVLLNNNIDYEEGIHSLNKIFSPNRLYVFNSIKIIFYIFVAHYFF